MRQTCAQQRRRLLSWTVWLHVFRMRLSPSKHRYTSKTSCLWNTVFTVTFRDWVICDISNRGSTLRIRSKRLRNVVNGQYRMPTCASKLWMMLWHKQRQIWPNRCVNTRTWWTSSSPWTLRSPPTGNCWREKSPGRKNLNIYVSRVNWKLYHNFKH